MTSQLAYLLILRPCVSQDLDSRVRHAVKHRNTYKKSDNAEIHMYTVMTLNMLRFAPSHT